MKTLLTTNELAKQYIEYIKKQYNVVMDYGDINYKYPLELPNFLSKSPNGKNYIKVDDIKTPYYNIYIPLPNACGLFDINLIYSYLNKKYHIIAWDEKKNLVTIEYIHENSIKEWLKSM